MGPRLIVPRASFSGGIYEDEYGYTCIHFVGGRTGIGSNFTKLPLIGSCEKMCFPTKIVDDYIDSMYNLFYTPINIENNNDDQHKSNPFDIFNRDKYTIWVMMGAIIIIFTAICIIMLIMKMRNDSMELNENKNNNNNETTPLLLDINHCVEYQ